jgi:glycyl-tRNA synthetase beta chain
MNSTVKNLLVELLVEELPPKALKSLGEAFAIGLKDSLGAQGLIGANAVTTSFASPRRLAVHVTAVAAKAIDKAVQQKLMPVNVALDASGQATPALLKKLASLGLDTAVLPTLKRAPDGKNEALFIDNVIAGATLSEGLKKAFDEALTKLPIPKVMTYQLADGWTTVNFVRPAHGLVALHGDQIIPLSVLGLTSGRTTQGHRFEASKPSIELQDADSYAQQLADEGAVIASFAARRAEIANQLQQAAAKQGLTPIADEALLDEVTGLVERPNVLLCQFEPEFLEVPQECLILTMKANQKYFPLLDAAGKLTNKFLVGSNIRPADPSRVIQGNERVVRPRLADAKFFFDQDRKKPLMSRLEGLAKVVYHNKLGSMLDRVERINALALHILAQLPPSAAATQQTVEAAAQLCKCDLLSLMVGEFPELQGIMGRYYALADNRPSEVAEAIREHYLPRGAGDELPATTTGMALALADKLDTIAGVFAIDQKPTGTKDPFGARRAAIGVLRIIIERELSVDLYEAIKQSLLTIQPDMTRVAEASAKASNGLFVNPTGQVFKTDYIYDYIMERLRAYYLEGNTQLKVTTEMFDAVLANRPGAPLDFDKRLRALESFLKLSDAQSLAAANKRISNILKKTAVAGDVKVRAELLQEPAERDLCEQLQYAEVDTQPLFAAGNYQDALTRLASLRPAVDKFFDDVMVMTDDIEIRNNRLALLGSLRAVFLKVADLSRLPG